MYVTCSSVNTPQSDEEHLTYTPFSNQPVESLHSVIFISIICPGEMALFVREMASGIQEDSVWVWGMVYDPMVINFPHFFSCSGFSNCPGRFLQKSAEETLIKSPSLPFQIFIGIA